MAYDDDYKYPFNNFLFKVDLAAPASRAQFPGTQPGTVKAPPSGVSTVIVKLSNPRASDANNSNRVPNDVAAQQLVRQPLAAAGLEGLIPDVYAWAPARLTDEMNEKDFGWIISEFKAGVDLCAVFPDLTDDAREQVLEQIATAFAAVQAVELPETVTKFGGLTFNENNEVISGEAPFRQINPMADSIWSSSLATCAGVLMLLGKIQLSEAGRQMGFLPELKSFLVAMGLGEFSPESTLHRSA